MPLPPAGATAPEGVAPPVDVPQPPIPADPAGQTGGVLPPELPSDAQVVAVGQARGRALLWPIISSVGAWFAGGAIALVAAGLAWWLVRPQLGRPFASEEIALARAGLNAAESGFLSSAQAGNALPGALGSGTHLLDWAPLFSPLYLSLLGLAFRHWGETEAAARIVGVACHAITAVLLFATATAVLRPHSRAAPVYAGLGTAVYVTNPLVLQQALLVDAESTLRVTSIALVTLVYALIVGSARPLRHPLTTVLLGLAALSLALGLWSSLTLAPALPIVLVAAALYRLVPARPWRPWRAFVELPFVGLGGAAFFMLTWSPYSLISGAPFWYPAGALESALSEASGAALGRWGPDNHSAFFDLAGRLALWVSPYLLALFSWAAASRFVDLALGPFVVLGRRALKRAPHGEPWGAWPVDFVLTAGVALAVVHLLHPSWSFPKELVSAMPLWATGVAYLVFRYVPSLRWWEVPVYGIVLSGMAGYFTSFASHRYVLSQTWDVLSALLVWPAALGAAFMVLSVTLNRRHLPRQLAILGMLLTLAWSWGVNLAELPAAAL